MFIKILYFFFLIFLLSCSTADKKLKVEKIKKNPPPEKVYELALKNFENEKLYEAVELLKIIDKDYSYSVLAPKALLMSSYIYYQSNKYLQALTNLKKYKELYPADTNLVYAEYLIGICFYEQINFVSKNQSNTHLALKQFNNVIKKYPKTIFAEEAKIKNELIYEQLAGHEMYVARYYINKEMWIAAITRLQIVIEKYQKTIFIDEALHRMVEINYRLGNLETAKKYAAILGYNYNSSDWYKKTYKIVADKNYSTIDQKNTKSFTEKFLNIFKFSKND